MLVRRGWRRHAAASLLLVVIAGLSAALVGASYQAADRAATSLDRFAARSLVYDTLVQGCPPGVDPDSLSSQADLLAQCVSPAATERLARVVGSLPDVVRTTPSATLVVGLLDPTAPNGWGRLGLMEATSAPGAGLDRGNPIVVEGRNIDPDAPDEVVLSETAAHHSGVHAGDTVEIAGWNQANLDRAIDGKVRPETPPSRAHVVGVVRFLDDVQASGDVSLSDSLLVGNVYAGPGWSRAHAAGLSGYGSAVLLTQRDRPGATGRIRRALHDAGWQIDVTPLVDGSANSPKKVIDIERRAVLAFAGIAAIAGLAFVGSTLVRQLRRETGEVAGVAALGMTRIQVRAVNASRAATVALPAALVAVVGVVLLSPLGPLGLARRLEFSTGVRVSPGVLATTAAAVVLVLTALGATVSGAQGARRRIPGRASWITTTASAAGPVPAVGATIARGRTTRSAVAMIAVALAACLAATGVVASYDALVSRPAHYGSWWDVVVGQYSERAPFRQGETAVRSNPNVVAAAAYGDETTAAQVRGRAVRLIGYRPVVGRRGPVTTSGHAPRADDEVVLGRATATRLHRHIGDDIVVTSTLGGRRRLRVVGITVVSDPISGEARPDEGLVVRYPLLTELTRSTVPQSIVVQLDPTRDRDAAIASLQRDFSGSIRAAVPQTDVRNVGRLRSLPWLLAALVVLLALVTLVHSLVTILGRNRATLAIVGALGFVRRQRRGVAAVAAAGLALVGAAIGVPLGLLLGVRLWATVADGMGLTASATWPWIVMIGAPVTAVVVAAVVAVVASRGPVRIRPGRDLRVE